MTETYAIQVIGMGPAGIGPFLVADKQKKLGGLLTQGVAWFDRARTGSAGAIGKYDITSNSPIGDYLETIDPEGDFAPVLDSVAKGTLKSPHLRRDMQIALGLIGELASAIQHRLAELIAQFPKSRIVTSGVESVIWDGEAFTTVSRDGTHRRSKKLVLACGAKEDPAASLPFLPSGWNGEVRVASDILTGRARPEHLRVHILGSSHSAASVLLTLFWNKREFTIWHRRTPKLFYRSQQEAIAAGYAFREEDVCPVTGRVNRFGGIRGPYRELMREALEGKLPNVEFCKFGELSKHGPAADTDLVIQALGFRANRIPIVNSEGSPVGPLMTKSGHLDVDSDCRVYDLSQQPIPGLYALGLGHQPPPAPQLGGEASHRGPIDGWNMYGGVVGERVLAGISS